MRGLYAIVDTETLGREGIPAAAFAEAVLDASPAALQLRDKRGDARATLDLLRAIAPLCRRAGVPFFANDRPDLAVLANCDGVHLGQDDVPVSVARSAGGARALRIGLSTHDAVQLEAAEREEDLAYVAVGPVFPTQSKERPSPVLGIERLAELSALADLRRPGRPLVAIGGVTLATAPAIGSLCACVAVIGALLPEERGPRRLDDVRDRARALHAAIVGVRRGYCIESGRSESEGA